MQYDTLKSVTRRTNFKYSYVFGKILLLKYQNDSLRVWGKWGELTCIKGLLLGWGIFEGEGRKGKGERRKEEGVSSNLVRWGGG
ncbi:hypothetical protein M2480_001116 [Parabacteroides sp. PFB2-12]|uniref:hypothetical protein n=1 Tax=unclassified Parabacteroides TaxID=2649774 RepID=UPI0024744D2F|nr:MULTISPECIES: hypothetical protein [unclassified Parabacteroides]MDH6342494.1 hypothetical protein [Parabacteroides sp. PM6-13]MDH6390146.1 hypothetical protein [Parabacteroides sp. PFB2-12]